MRKAFTVFMTVLLVAMLMVMPAMANTQDSDIAPTSLQSTTCSLSISGITAKYSCAISGVTCDKLSATLSLQKYKDGSWQTVKSSTDSSTTGYLIIEKSKLITAGKFRAKAVVTATKGTQKETITYYSAVKTKE